MATRNKQPVQGIQKELTVFAIAFTPYTGSLANPAGSPNFMPQYFAQLGLSGSTALIPQATTGVVSGSYSPIVRFATGSFQVTLRNPWQKIISVIPEYEPASSNPTAIYAVISGSKVDKGKPRPTHVNSVTASFVDVLLIQGSGSNTVLAGSTAEVNGQPGDRVTLTFICQDTVVPQS